MSTLTTFTTCLQNIIMHMTSTYTFTCMSYNVVITVSTVAAPPAVCSSSKPAVGISERPLRPGRPPHTAFYRHRHRLIQHHSKPRCTTSVRQRHKCGVPPCLRGPKNPLLHLISAWRYPADTTDAFPPRQPTGQPPASKRLCSQGLPYLARCAPRTGGRRAHGGCSDWGATGTGEADTRTFRGSRKGAGAGAGSDTGSA